MYELLGYGLVIGVLLWLLLRSKENEGKSIEKTEQMDDYIKAMEKSAKEGKENAKTISSLSRDEFIKRVQK